MRRRTLKCAALVVSGGLLLQVAGCGTVLVELALQNVVTTIISGLLDALLGGGGTTP